MDVSDCRVCKTGSEEDAVRAESGWGDGGAAAGAGVEASDCRVCKTGSEDDGAAGVDSAARGSGAPGALGLPPGDGSGAAGTLELPAAGAGEAQ